jgi:hypothetical protein
MFGQQASNVNVNANKLKKVCKLNFWKKEQGDFYPVTTFQEAGLECDIYILAICLHMHHEVDHREYKGGQKCKRCLRLGALCSERI